MFSGLALRHFVLTIACLLSLPIAAGVFKWVDEDGTVHFSDHPPQHQEAEELSEQALPKYDAPTGKANVSTPKTTLDPKSAAIPKSQGRGRLPDNTKSEYLETKSAGFVIRPVQKSAQYHLVFAARPGLPFGAVFDVEFENPADKANRLSATVRRSGASDRIWVESPVFWPMKCGKFLVEVSIYRNTLRSTLLGIHQQHVQSRVDAEKARTTSELIEAMLNGNCP